MISDNRSSLGYSMLGFLAVSLFILMLIFAIVDYPEWVCGETLITDIIDSGSPKYLLMGSAAGGFLLAFSAIGKLERGRLGRIGEGLFVILVGIFTVWAAVFGYGSDIFDVAVRLVILALFLAVLFSIYDDFKDNRHMVFGSLSIIFFMLMAAMIAFSDPEVYQLGIVVLGPVWILIRSIRDLYA